MIVDGLTPVTRALRTFASLVLIGFLALVLAPPLLFLLTGAVSALVGLFAAFLPFALVGLLIWVPYHVLTHGGEATWQRAREMVVGLGRTTFAIPLRVCGAILSRSLAVGRWVLDFNRQAVRFVGVLLFEALSGALVGGLVGFLVASDSAHQPVTIAICAALGAGFGGLTAIGRFRGACTEETAPA